MTLVTVAYTQLVLFLERGFRASVRIKGVRVNRCVTVLSFKYIRPAAFVGQDAVQSERARHSHHSDQKSEFHNSSFVSVFYLTKRDD